MRRIIPLTMAAALALTGCGNFYPFGAQAPSPPPAESKTETPKTGEATYLSQLGVRADEKPEGTTAVESALKWSEKYSRAVEELILAQRKLGEVEEQHRKLASELAKVRSESEQDKKELAEANAMLMEMRGELDRWKANVLGFRDEMRRAQTAQLEALRRILEMLGGEMPKVAAPSTQPAANQAAKAKDPTGEHAPSKNG